MTKSEILEWLRAEANRVVAAVPHVRMFVFGSILHTDSWPSDIDVLVVYESALDVASVRALINPLFGEIPLHVLFLSRAEEVQLHFVASEHCVPLS